MKKPSIHCAILLAVSSLAWAGPSIDFSSGGNQSIKVKPNANSPALIELTKEGLAISGENFWTIQAMANDISLPLGEVSDKKCLEIEISGSTQDEGPVLRAILVSADWKTQWEYVFALDSMSATTPSKIKATTPLSKPVKFSDGGELAEGSGEAPPPETTVAHLIFITKAKAGNQPWKLKIKSLGVTKTDPNEPQQKPEVTPEKK